MHNRHKHRLTAWPITYSRRSVVIFIALICGVILFVGYNHSFCSAMVVFLYIMMYSACRQLS